MAYKTINEFREEGHPWEPFIPVNADKLILGTFPTAEGNRGAYEFFYPNPNNDFWRVLFRVAEKKMEDFRQAEPVQIRKQILTDLKLGIGDIGKRILRQKESSKDDSLFPIEYTDVFSILDNHPTIRKIIITSSSGGNSVLSWFHHYTVINGHNFIIPKGKLPLKTGLIFKGREIKIEIVSSPSRLSPIKGDKLFEMYRNAIITQ
jgi:G:T/U-mismatch repair DNA glycosylase